MRKAIATKENEGNFDTGRATDEHHSKHLIYQVWSALQARDVAKAADIISSLGAFGASILGVEYYLAEIQRIRKEEEVRTRNIKALNNLEVHESEVSRFFSTLAKYKIEKEKITAEIENAMLRIGFSFGASKQQEAHCTEMYDRLMSEYGSKPRSIDVIKEILKIEILRFGHNDNAIKSMHKEYKNLARQAKKLFELHKKIKDQFSSEEVTNPLIKKETAKFLAGIEKEISEVELLVIEVASSIKKLEEAKKEAQSRAKFLGEKIANNTLSDLLIEFVSSIFTFEAKKKRASESGEGLLPHHKTNISEVSKHLHRDSQRDQRHDLGRGY